jgi:hypothetical protein
VVATESRDRCYCCRVQRFNEVAELGYLLSQSVGLVPGDEYQLVILASVGDGMCYGYGDGSVELYATVDDSDVLIT